MNFYKSLTSILLILSSLTIYAQPGGRDGGQGEIYGNIIDSLSEKPVSFVIVKVMNAETDALVGGATTAENG